MFLLHSLPIKAVEYLQSTSQTFPTKPNLYKILSPKISTLSLRLLFTLTASADTSLHYKLRARVTGPKNDETPEIDGWAVEVQRLGVNDAPPTRLHVGRSHQLHLPTQPRW